LGEGALGSLRTLREEARYKSFGTYGLGATSQTPIHSLSSNFDMSNVYNPPKHTRILLASWKESVFLTFIRQLRKFHQSFITEE
jgi:hypothetical protein